MESLETRIEKLENELKQYKAIGQQTRRDQLTQYLIEKLDIGDDFSAQLELAVLKTDVSESRTFTQIAEDAEKLFREYCKKSGMEFASPDEVFEKYIKQKQAEQQEEDASAERLKKFFFGGEEWQKTHGIGRGF